MRSVCAALALCAIVVVAETNSNSPHAEEETWNSEQDATSMSTNHRDPTVKFLLRDTTDSGTATEKLRERWGFQVKSGTDRRDSLVETFGKRIHGMSFSQLGFDLVQTDEGNGFSVSDKASGYHNPKQLHEAFKQLVSKYPSQAKIYDLTSEYQQSKTKEGRSIYAIKLSDNVQKDESEPNVLLVSNHHARELIVPELALSIATNLLKGYEKRSKAESGELLEVDQGEEAMEAKDAKDILDKNQVYIMWTMNPDGLNAVWNSNAWKRTNANNVDLNRNYPIGWSAACGGSTDKDGETWRGPKPFSEAETQTMKAFQENRNFAKVMDFHSYSQEVRTNYGSCAQLPKAIDQHFQQIRDAVAQKMHYTPSRSCCMGGNIHYAYNRHGSLAYLVETGNAFQPAPQEMQSTLTQVWPGTKRFLQQPISVSGVITDAETGQPVQAKLTLPGVDFKLKERLQSGKRGHYHLWLPDGPHKLEVHAAGKPVKKLTVQATEQGTVQNIKV
jgi:hypothetical protein